MNKILAFDSLFIVNPIRKIYIGLVKKILNYGNTKNKLVLYRLDKENIFINDNRNITGMTIGLHKDKVELLSIEFYRYLEKSGICNGLLIKDIQLYKLYTRQVKLKLAAVLKSAIRIRKLSLDIDEDIEIITDKQSASMMKEAFLFLNFEPTNVNWNVNYFLTLCISFNSLTMRLLALLKIFFSSSNLPKKYFYKHVDSNAPTVLLTMPKRRPYDFFITYVDEFGGKFNIILYSLGPLSGTPKNYKVVKIKRSIGIFKGIFNFKNMWLTADSYIADILLIYKNHVDLSTSIDIVNAVFSNKIDAYVNRQQALVLENHLALEARSRGIFILGDIFEEIYYCDTAICPSESENTASLRLATSHDGKIVYKGSNSLINYRLKNFTNKRVHYLHKLLNINTKKKLIFYASDPSKEESQRYITEKFLMSYFLRKKNFILVIKTHPQDNGNITNIAYDDTGKPSNVILIGDIMQKDKMISKEFFLFNDFDFNSAITSSDGFLTFSSSSILQALTLGVKTGIVDLFKNGYYDYLINHEASILINNDQSLEGFLKSKRPDVSDKTLRYCGLRNDSTKFDVGEYLSKCLEKFQKNNEKN